MTTLDWINFGKVSAEQDELLSNYFFDNGVMNRILNSTIQFLVLGRKGAGKTAVFQFFCQNPEQYEVKKQHVISLSLQDYNWSIHSLLKSEGQAPALSYSASWKFLILVEYLIQVKKLNESDQFALPKSVKRANKIIEKVFGQPYPTIGEIIGRKALQIAKLRLPGGGFDITDGDIEHLDVSGGEVSFHEMQQDSDLASHLSTNLNNLTRIFEAAVNEIDENQGCIFVCFDRVDEAWIEGSFDESKRMIAGLVNAAAGFRPELRKRVRPIIFLREDIFEELSLNDKTKLREDCGELLNWEKDSLMKMIMARVKYFADINGEVAPLTVDALFDKEKMRQQLSPASYLLKRTMARPRDLICLLNKTVSSMHDDYNDQFDEVSETPEKLECDAIYAAEPSYSEWLRSEILDEWATQKPLIEQLLSAIQSNGSTNFSQHDLSVNLEKLGVSLSKLDVTAHLRFLFDNSIIGIKIGKSNQWKFKCFNKSQAFLATDDYRVHDGLIKVLNLRERRAKEDDSAYGDPEKLN